MKIRLALLTMAVALAGCASHGHAPRVQQRYATSEYLAAPARRVAVAPAYAPAYASYGGGHARAGYAGHGGGGHAGHGGKRGKGGHGGGHHATACATNPCAACAPASRTIYYDAGTVTVDHVHRYREIHRHRLEVTKEDVGCVDCP